MSFPENAAQAWPLGGGWGIGSLHSVSFAVSSAQIIFLEVSGTRRFQEAEWSLSHPILKRSPLCPSCVVEVPQMLFLRRVSPPLSSSTTTAVPEERAGPAWVVFHQCR